jgi:hypothetical protein
LFGLRVTTTAEREWVPPLPPHTQQREGGALHQPTRHLSCAGRPFWAMFGCGCAERNTEGAWDGESDLNRLATQCEVIKARNPETKCIVYVSARVDVALPPAHTSWGSLLDTNTQLVHSRHCTSPLSGVSLVFTRRCRRCRLMVCAPFECALDTNPM